MKHEKKKKEEKTMEMKNTIHEEGKAEAEKGQIVWLDTDLLVPHPDNPRKNLGDLSELVESIKINGVMQNLTVVPYIGRGLPKSKGDGNGCYTVVIGHRRSAAAKQAGLTKLPCVIADLSEKQQLGIMLAENMQRSDLTVVEQAQSMQMMLDLGETEDTISEITGFSKKTVKDRLKLNKLDQQALAKAVGRQVSFADLLKLDKIEDEAQRNEVLATAGTNNFDAKYKEVIKSQECKARISLICEKLSAFADEKKSGYNYTEAGYRYRTFFAGGRRESELLAEIDIYREKYIGLDAIYIPNDSGVGLYTKKTAEEESESIKLADRNKREEKLDKIDNKLRVLTERHYELRLEWVKNATLSSPALVESLLNKFIENMMCQHSYTTTCSRLRTVLADKKTPLEKAVKGYKNRPQDLLLALAYAETGDHRNNGYYSYAWESGGRCIKYKKNDNLDSTYAFLCQYGYEMSDEEKELQNGTHPLFAKADKIMEGA